MGQKVRGDWEGWPRGFLDQFRAASRAAAKSRCWNTRDGRRTNPTLILKVVGNVTPRVQVYYGSSAETLTGELRFLWRRRRLSGRPEGERTGRSDRARTASGCGAGPGGRGVVSAPGRTARPAPLGAAAPPGAPAGLCSTLGTPRRHSTRAGTAADHLPCPTWTLTAWHCCPSPRASRGAVTHARSPFSPQPASQAAPAPFEGAAPAEMLAALPEPAGPGGLGAARATHQARHLDPGPPRVVLEGRVVSLPIAENQAAKHPGDLGGRCLPQSGCLPKCAILAEPQVLMRNDSLDDKIIPELEIPRSP